MTILLVEHNLSVALGAAGKACILRDGQVRFEGRPDEFSEDEFVQRAHLAGRVVEIARPYRYSLGARMNA